MEISYSYPLQFPWERSTGIHHSKFDPKGRRTFPQARDEVFRQLELLEARKVIVSSNLLLGVNGRPFTAYRVKPVDQGIAFYVTTAKTDLVFACDWWSDIIDNAWAVAKDIDAARGRERWKATSSNRVFQGNDGYLPPPKEPQSENWWEVLGVSQNAVLADIEKAFRTKSKQLHPDMGGDEEQMAALTRAYAEAKKNLK